MGENVLLDFLLKEPIATSGNNPVLFINHACFHFTSFHGKIYFR
jgi:hypothetical protein